MADTHDQAAPCTGYDAKTGRPCARAVARRVRAGCAHEHVGVHQLCLAHTSDLGDGTMLCGSCLDAGHDCKLSPLDPAEAKVARRDWTRELLAQLGPVDEELLDVLSGGDDAAAEVGES